MMMVDWLHGRRWEPVTAPLTNGSDHRGAKQLEAVLAQFDLKNARYTPTELETYCTTLLWDATRALSCEAPHYWLVGDKVFEQDANAYANWFALYGPRHGWLAVDEPGAVIRVNAGMPVVGVAKNPKGHGHAVLGKPGTGPKLLVKMAGRTNLESVELAHAFGDLHPILYSHA